MTSTSKFSSMSAAPERVEKTRTVLALYPATRDIREVELDSFLTSLPEARDWLLDNERGREI